MVDPIDGTRDFIAGDDGYAVMIGLCVDGRPQVGALAMPATGMVYAGIAGGAGLEADARRDAARPCGPPRWPAPPGIRLVASKSHRTRNIDAFRQALGIEDEMNVGSVGVKVGLVADGSRDLYVYPGSPHQALGRLRARGDPARRRAAGSPTCAGSGWSTPARICTTGAASWPPTAPCTTGCCARWPTCWPPSPCPR